MRTLLLFIIRFNYVFAFLLLEAVAIAFVVSNHAYHRVGFLNSAGFVTGNIFGAYHGLGEYLSLGEINKKLMEENAMLKMTGQLNSDTAVYIDFCNDSLDVQYRYIPMKAINFSVNKSNNFITLNKGWKHGIEKDMGVVTASGIVGIVNQVSANFSNAMSVLHKDSRISIKVKRFNYPGTLQWESGNPAVADIIGIPMHLPIAVGDSVVTSGFSSIFPENLPVGVISEFTVPKGKSFYNVKVRLSANLETLQYAYVIQNVLQDEQRELEEANR